MSGAIQNKNSDLPLVRQGQEPQDSALLKLPAEILTYLLRFVVTSETPWNRVVGYILVCKQFSIIIKGFDRYQIWYVLKRSSFPTRMPSQLASQAKEIAQLDPCSYRTLACARVGKREIRYLCSPSDPSIRPTLYILSSSATGFEWSTIDVQTYLEPCCKDDTLKALIFVSPIIDCHPTENGFIIVQRAGFSLSQYDSSNQPKCLFYYSFSVYYDSIKYSTYKDGILYLTTDTKNPFDDVYKIDLHQKNLHVEKFLSDSSSSFKLMCTPDDLLLVQTKRREVQVELSPGTTGLLTGYSSYLQINKITAQGKLTEGEGLEIPAPRLPIFPVDLATSVRVVKNWILVSKPCFLSREGDRERLVVYDSQSLTEWIGEEMNLFTPSRDLEGHLFFMGDFLCLSYSKETKVIISYKKTEYPKRTRIIHLPTKKEYTEQLAPVLQLLGKEGVLCGLHLEIKATGNILHVLWEVEKPDDNFVLKSLQVPLQEAQETLVLPSTSNLSCDHKIVFIAGGALALIALIATLVLAFTYSGAPLLETNGFTLTIPTVVTFIVGETTALVVVCLGIYLRKRK